MTHSDKTTRYTATLPVYVLDELRSLAKSNAIPSVNYAIRQALDDYLAQMRKQQYDQMMKQAAQDPAFVSRTMKCAQDFTFADRI